MKKLNNLILLISLAVTTLAGIGAPYGYHALFLLPLIFSLCFYFILYPSIIETRSLTISCISVAAFIRYVVLAFAYRYNPCYDIGGYLCNDGTKLTISILFMCYELIFVSIFSRLIAKKYKATFRRTSPSFNNINSNNLIIPLYIAFCAIVVILTPSVWSNIHFFKLETNTIERVGESDLTTKELMVRQFFLIGMLLLFTYTMISLNRSFKKSGKTKIIYLSIALAFLPVSVIISEQRAVQIYIAFSTMFFLCRLYPTKKRLIIISISSIVLVILSFLSIYKTFYAFNASSYAEAFIDGYSNEFSLSYQLEAYALGPVSVTAVFDLMSSKTYSYTLLLFDFLRSTIGPSFLVKHMNIETTTVLYNNFVTGGILSNGYLIPISAQGAMFLTPIFGPLLLCLYLRIAFYMEKLIRHTENAHICVFVAYMFIRFSTCMISSNINTINTMASLTIIFILPILLPSFISKLK